MNFGFVVFAWVVWIIAHNALPNVPEPSKGWMIFAAVVGLMSEPSIKNVIQKDK